MNNRIFISLLLFTSLYSDAKMYVGINYGNAIEKFTNLDAKSSGETITAKIGYGDIKAYAIELSVDRIKNESNIFSNSDGNRYSLNVELIKSFDFNTFLNPFFKLGFGTGGLKIDREIQDNLKYGSYNLGVGTFIPITNYIDLEIGYNYRYVSYEKIDIVVHATSYKSHLNTLYSGINIRF